VQGVLVWVLAANFLLIGTKLAIGLRTGSIAVLGDAAHSGVDAINNVIALLAVRVAAQPPDEEHPYGHGKFDTLGALAVVSFLSITCFELVLGAARRLIAGEAAPEVDAWAFLTLGGALVVSLLVARVEARFGERLDSQVLLADSRDKAADALITLSVLVGLALVRLGWPAADGWLALLVVVLVAHSGYQIVRATVPVLVDHRALDADQIVACALDVVGVNRAVEIRSRGRRGAAFAELTIHVDPGMNVETAHRIADGVERRLEREVGFTRVVVHVEPSPPEDSTAG